MALSAEKMFSWCYANIMYRSAILPTLAKWSGHSKRGLPPLGAALLNFAKKLKKRFFYAISARLVTGPTMPSTASPCRS